MKKTMKKILCSLLIVVMCLTATPLQGFVGLDFKVEAVDYKVGDIIQFGSYPQTEVKDEAVIEKLNSLAPAWDDWTSYGYYSGDGNYGSMVQGDWMRYIDIVYNGNKYRGIKFTQYRPDVTLSASPFSAYDGNHTNQDENGYYINKNYWFEFEPINWRILDPNSGLVMCEALIDSQPYSNTIYSNGIGNFGGIFNDRFYDNYASDYETSSIRKWLNNEFYDLAFTGDEKEEINTTVLNNNSYYTTLGIAGYGELDSKETEDKIFIPSYDEVINNKFGFHSDPNEKDTARMAEATDYSKCQGAFVAADEYKNNTYWILRSPGGYSNWCCSVYRSGRVDGAQLVYCSDAGVRPALRLKDIATATQKASSYFMVSSDTYSVDSLNRKKTATYKINLLDANSNFLPIDNVTIKNNTTDIVTISTKKVSDTEIELTVEPLKDGDASISLFNGDGSLEQFFNFIVYSNTTTYRADQVPVTNEELKTNFSRGDMTVDNFEYYFDENKGKYIATMDVYNRSGAIGIVAAYTQDGLISDIEQVDPYKPLPSDFGEFLIYLGTGAVSIAKGENWNYRYSGYCQKTSIEIEIPEDGYITVSCDILADEIAMIYSFVSLSVETAFKTAEIIDYLGTDTDKLAKEASKTIVRKTSEYFKSKKGKDWLGSALSKLSKKMSKQFSIAYLEDMSLLSFEMVEELCANIGTDFSKLFFEVIDELIQEEIKSFGVMSVSKKLIKDKVIGVAERNFLKVASAIFDGGAYINLANKLVGTYLYNQGTGKTKIVFMPKGEDGFVCLDTIKVTSDIITDEVLLNTYIIKDTQKEDTFIRGRIHPYFNRDDGLDDREISVDLNRVVEIHEISLLKNGEVITDGFTATVEMFLPSYIDRRTCSVYRVEKDGTYTKLDTRIEDGKIIFETDHFSEYILTGIRNDIEGTTPCDEHVYEEVRVEPTCTETGSLTYTCYCGETYIETIAKLSHNYTAVATAPTCTDEGYTTYTCACGDSYIDNVTGLADHTDDDGDEFCDYCDEFMGSVAENNCSHMCHKTGIIGFIWKIINFFCKLFGINPVCECGKAHY